MPTKGLVTSTVVRGSGAFARGGAPAAASGAARGGRRSGRRGRGWRAWYARFGASRRRCTRVLLFLVLELGDVLLVEEVEELPQRVNLEVHGGGTVIQRASSVETFGCAGAPLAARNERPGRRRCDTLRSVSGGDERTPGRREDELAEAMLADSAPGQPASGPSPGMLLHHWVVEKLGEGGVLALGCVLYEAVTGRRAFPAKDIATLVQDIFDALGGDARFEALLAKLG